MVTKLSTSAAGSAARSESVASAANPALARVREAGLILAGTVALALIGQIAIPLPFTPVPISMGTFAALGVGAVLGSRRGAMSALRRRGPERKPPPRNSRPGEPSGMPACA